MFYIPNIFFSCLLDEFLDIGCHGDGGVPELEFEQLPFNHPLYIMYSSGTTGAPKCMVHSAGVSTSCTQAAPQGHQNVWCIQQG